MSNLLSRLLGKSTARPEPAQTAQLRVLMVCMGNICRSPTAEAVLRQRLQHHGLADEVFVDSAGTHAHHVGSPPDPRSIEVGAQRGYELAHLRARKLSQQDYESFDVLLAMDWDNFALLEEGCPEDLRRKLHLLTEFIPTSHSLAGAPVVPDPYYGGPAGFAHVLDLVEAACDGLAVRLQKRLERMKRRKAEKALARSVHRG